MLTITVLGICLCARPAMAFEVTDVFVGKDSLDGWAANYNHAASLVRLADGTFVCTWFSGAQEGNVDNHLMISRSRDGGQTWSAPEVAVELPGDSLARDPTISWLDGGLWLTYVMQSAPGSGSKAPNSAVMVRTSADTGRTWSEARLLDVGRERTYAFSKPIELLSGEWLFPFYWRYNAYRQPHASVLITADSLKTWTTYGDLVLPDSGWALEPAIVQRSDGSLLMHLRTNVGILYRSVSNDLGRTWSAPETTGLPNSDRPGLTRWDDGTLLAVMPDALDRDFMSVWMSDDQGWTWPRRLSLGRRIDGQVSYGYPIAWGDSLAVVWTSLEYPNWPISQVIGTIKFARARRDEVPQITTETSPGWHMQQVSVDPLPTLKRVVFTSRNDGWIAGTYLWHTTDGGVVWDTVSAGLSAVTNVLAWSDGHVWVSGWNERTAMSEDSGVTWQWDTSPRLTYDVSFVTPGVGWGAYSGGSWTNGLIYTTQDSGKTWSCVIGSQNTCAFMDIEATLDGTIIAAGNFGGIVRSTNGGGKWQLSTIPGQTFTSVDLVDDRVGWLAGDGALFRTLDAGETWEKLTTPLPYPWQDVVALDSLTAWAVGRDAIIRTWDAGKNWQTERLGAGHYLFGLSVQPNQVVAVGYNGEIWTKSGPTEVSRTSPVAASVVTFAQPNPFNAQTMIVWQLDIPGGGSVRIYDLTGRLVRHWDVPWAAAGPRSITWDGLDGQGRPTGSGTYVYRIRIADRTLYGRVTLTR